MLGEQDCADVDTRKSAGICTRNVGQIGLLQDQTNFLQEFHNPETPMIRECWRFAQTFFKLFWHLCKLTLAILELLPILKICKGINP